MILTIKSHWLTELKSPSHIDGSNYGLDGLARCRLMLSFLDRPASLTVPFSTFFLLLWQAHIKAQLDPPSLKTTRLHRPSPLPKLPDGNTGDSNAVNPDKTFYHILIWIQYKTDISNSDFYSDIYLIQLKVYYC